MPFLSVPRFYRPPYQHPFVILSINRVLNMKKTWCELVYDIIFYFRDACRKHICHMNKMITSLTFIFYQGLLLMWVLTWYHIWMLRFLGGSFPLPPLCLSCNRKYVAQRRFKKGKMLKNLSFSVKEKFQLKF